jgi:Bifunctional DNA primase/polymerase, N-terminal
MGERTHMCRVALSYAARGWRVMPVTQRKTPLLMGGHKVGTTDREQIKQWWSRWERPIAICTGPESDNWVMDIDPSNGGDETLASLEAKYGPLPETLMARTASGGTHYYFRYPKRVVIRSSAGKIGPGIDHRGLNGYVVAPPSTVAHGDYEWITPLDTPIARAPRWLECFTLSKKQRLLDGGLFPCWYCGLLHHYRHELRMSKV